MGPDSRTSSPQPMKTASSASSQQLSVTPQLGKGALCEKQWLETKNSLHLTNGSILIWSLSEHQLISLIYSFVDEEDKDSLQELAAEQKCFVEHILCTKPLPCR